MNDRPPANPPTRGRFLRSVRFAGRGIAELVRRQPNARIHAVITALVIIAGFVFALRAWEWCAVVLAIGLVWTAEALNTAIEALTDLVSPDPHPLAGRAKDLAAGGVLCAAIAAAVIGLIVFGPHLVR